MTTIDISRTKLKDEQGKLIDFFHVTPHPGGIQRHYPLSHFGTERAAKMRAVHFIFKSLGIPEGDSVPEQLPDRYIHQLKENTPQLSTQKVHLYMKHPKAMRDLGAHDIQQYRIWFVNEYSPKVKFLSKNEWQELAALGHQYMDYKTRLAEFIFIDPFTHSTEELVKELNAESLFNANEWIHDNTLTRPSFLRPVLAQSKQVPLALGERVSFQRMIRFLEGEGYDGFKYVNTFEDRGKLSYIIFRPEQVFNALIPENKHVIPDLKQEDKVFLYQQEKAFFEKIGMLSPTERIGRSLKMSGRSYE